jgi:hypothetical protein
MAQEWDVIISVANANRTVRVAADNRDDITKYLRNYGPYALITILPAKQGEELGLAEGEVVPHPDHVQRP